MSTPLSWFFYTRFDAIPALHLFEILRLRQQVFVIEQDCIYEDIDLLDPLSEHLLITPESQAPDQSSNQPLKEATDIHSENLLHKTAHPLHHSEALATLRIVPAGAKFKEVSIGRIVVREDARNLGLGEKMVRNALAILQKRGETEVRIEAQHHLASWYESMGFAICSNVFDLDGIPHIQMICKLQKETSPK